MGSQLHAYTGVYIQIQVEPVEHFTKVAFCSATCTEHPRFFSVDEKFCSRCGAPAAHTERSDGFQKPFVHVPDELESLWFSPASGLAVLKRGPKSPPQTDIWMPNFNNAPFELTAGQAAQMNAQMIERCWAAFAQSEPAKKALAYLTKKGIPHEPTFGSILFYL